MSEHPSDHPDGPGDSRASVGSVASRAPVRDRLGSRLPSRLRSRLRGHRGAPRRWVLLSRLVGFALLTVLAYLGGIAATSVFPTTVHTKNYTAEVRLSALPRLVSTLHSPTSLGDIDLTFGGPLPAPGVDAIVGVRENITNLFTDRQVSISALQPSDAEISRALESAVRQLGLRFAAGALTVAALTVSLLAYGRRRRPTAHHLVAVGAALLTALGGTGIGMWQTYRPERLSSFTATGLLGMVRKNAGLLADVRERAQQVTPYVQNLLALSQALQEKFVPGEINQPTAARLLLVSDIHGANQYPLMSAIVKEEDITAVIDSGDLLNFGSITEAEAAGIFSSIAGLGVPYIFVRGNHDASSPEDRSLLERMTKIPNVVLLEPSPGTYTELAVNGVTVAGFNDPRFFGDDNKNNAAKQDPAADAFNRAFGAREAPDVVVSHEPAAVERVAKARVLINGHLHKDELDGHRIGVGTFTGGGTVSHFVQQEEAQKEGTKSPEGELAGQPYAFDIAAFGEGCDLTRLTRYTYRNLVQGRPAYDDVTVINGRTIEADPPTGRTCSADQGVARTTVSEPPSSATVPTGTASPAQ